LAPSANSVAITAEVFTVAPSIANERLLAAYARPSAPATDDFSTRTAFSHIDRDKAWCNDGAR
jgi:hypothetical protein